MAARRVDVTGNGICGIDESLDEVSQSTRPPLTAEASKREPVGGNQSIRTFLVVCVGNTLD